MGTGLSKPFNHMEPFEFESDDNEIAEIEIDLQVSMQEKLARAIDMEMNSKRSPKSPKNLNSISPSSVKPEIFFRIWKNCYQN
jgi:hypothetical protein